MRHLVFILAVALSDALSHSLSHDHWQPFLEKAMVRGWTGRHTLEVTAVGAFLHLAAGLGVGLLASAVVPFLTRRLGGVVPAAVNMGVVLAAVFYAWRALAAFRRVPADHPPEARIYGCAWAWREFGHE